MKNRKIWLLEPMQPIIDRLREFAALKNISMKINTFDGGLEVSFNIGYFDALKQHFSHVVKVEVASMEMSENKMNYNYFLLEDDSSSDDEE